MTPPSLTTRLAAHLARDVGKSDRRRARLHLLDWLGCVAGARETAAAGAVSRAESDPLMRAAFIGNILEMDDIHRSAILHPGPCVWPVVLAGKGDMEARLDAALRGYEAMIAIGATFDDRHYAFHHNTSTAGGFGAAAAAASLAGADEETMVAALGLAGSVSGGFWQTRHEDNLAKQWHVLHAIRTGCDAARLARAGATGPAFILEGPQGLYRATCETPGEMQFPDRWRLHTVSFKPWASCRHTHPAIDAALELKAKGALSGPIAVETFADAITFCDRPEPASVIEAKFSLQHAVAVVAEHGAPRPEHFEPAAITGLAEARGRVSVCEDAAFTQRYPDHYGARVSTGDGAIELADTRGDPERPLDDDGVVDKARMLIAWGGLADTEADRAVDLALAGEDPAALRALLGDWLG